MSALWRRRNALDWTLDLTMLTGPAQRSRHRPTTPAVGAGA
ncbi:hypothetical protein [Pengzhenrongella sp.]